MKPSMVMRSMGVVRVNQSAEHVAVLEAADIEALDGKHHLWCKHCHPEWVTRPLGAELAVPFVAICGQRAVILARWQSDAAPPGACETCADPTTPCATCGNL